MEFARHDPRPYAGKENEGLFPPPVPTEETARAPEDPSRPGGGPESLLLSHPCTQSHVSTVDNSVDNLYVGEPDMGIPNNNRIKNPNAQALSPRLAALGNFRYVFP